MRLATWNVNSLKARLERVEAGWPRPLPTCCACRRPSRRRRLPGAGARRPRLRAAHHGEGRWNGVAILSRVGIDDVVHGFADGGRPDAEARLLTARCGGTVVVTVYVPNGRAVGHEQFHYKLAWFDRLGRPPRCA